MSPHSLFSIILPRIFLLYNTLNAILLYLVPKKLRFFIPTSWCPHQANIFNKDSPSLSSSSSSSSSPPPLPSLSPNPSLVTSSPLVHKRLVMDPMELTRVFRMFDRNGDGRVTRKELNDSLENLGVFIPDKELIQIIGKIDVDGDGCVDVDEFGALYQELMQEREEEEEEDMKEAFDVFDQNGDGFITVDELRSVLASLGLKHGRTPEDCQMMITKVDADGDGMVNYKEFKQMMKGGGFSVLT